MKKEQEIQKLIKEIVKQVEQVAVRFERVCKKLTEVIDEKKKLKK